MKIVVAIPTIPERGEAWESVGAAWRAKTTQEVIIEPSWRKPTWAAGLNEVWEKHPDADILVCGSDDMTPRDDEWLPSIEPYLDTGVIAPQVIDPRFTRFAPEVKDGAPTDMSSFPILAGKWLSRVFPLPEELHYYSDNLISDRVPQTVAVPSCVIVHTMDMRGRGAGMGDESLRMAHDRTLYRKLLRRC